LLIRSAIWVALLIATCGTLPTVSAASIPDPPAPVAEVIGEPGGPSACYWVFAESAELLGGLPSHYIGSIRGKVTALSPPVQVRLPRNLGHGGKVILRVHPVPGALRYYILKTTPIPVPVAQVMVKKQGSGTLYYWVVAQNAWRRSPPGGPFLARNTDPEHPENEITVSPVLDATAYSYFVTHTPEPPVGRDYYGVAELVGPKITHTGGAAHVPAGFPPTPETEPPSGYGNFLLAVSDGGPIEDTGQPLTRLLPPNLNETDTPPITVPRDDKGSTRNPLNSLLSLRPIPPPQLAPEPSFAWTGFYPIWLDTVVDAGGINHYQSPPAGGGNYKSTIGSLSLGLTSRTASQHANLTGFMTTYGMGDSVWLAPQISVYGGMRDQGDEGVEILRSQVDRMAREVWLTVKGDAPRTGVSLPVAGDMGEVGTGRILINASRSYRRGRIEYVDNCTAHGLGTDWTPSMVGQWISFDVDSLPEPKQGEWSKIHPVGGAGPEDGVRQWYQIDRVLGPTQLEFRAITGWSAHCNLGFSRFVQDPQTGKGPGTLYVNRLANFYLPPDRKAASESGGYLIAPGTALDDPSRQGDALHTEPLREAWKAGDRVVVAAGPQTTITQGWFVQFGDYMPQDVVQGIAVMNFGTRTANGPGIHVGGDPATPGWQVGMLVTMPNSGAGDGIEIEGTHVRNAAILVPPGVPALRINQSSAPYLQGDAQTNSLEIKAPFGITPARFDGSGTVLQGKTTVEGELHLGENGTITGSPMSRGKVILSGDGATSVFTIRFPHPYRTEPVVYFKTNLFLRDALQAVSPEGFTVAFETPPPSGKGNITLWWMAQE
jgi:hypothetical protein